MLPFQRLMLLCAVAAPLLLSLRSASLAGAPSATGPDADAISETSIAVLEAELARGPLTAEELTRAYLARIAANDVKGAALHSVIALDPLALDEARRSDRERAAGKRPRPLEGIPILIKDNIETADGTATTAGSEALAFNVTRRNAPLVKRLLDAGAIVLGKTNLSEWANFRSSNSISGWSAMGGLVRNPYVLDRNACGSSSGTGAAISASFAAAGIGTETDGSITCPAAVNGLVGLKPTVGLVSRTYVVPISHNQDTPGPMGRSVADVAALLNVIAGSDPRDPATLHADRYKCDYVAMLRTASLNGKRLGILRFATSTVSASTNAVFARAVAKLKTQGARIVELSAFKPNPALGDAEQTVLLADAKTDLNAYLASTPHGVRARTLRALIAFNGSHPRELSLFGQDLFEKAEAGPGAGGASYRKARALALRYARSEGIDELLDRYKLDALIAPTLGPAWRTDTVDGDNASGGAGSLPAIAGYPHLTVPMGYVSDLPVGISFIGAAWSEGKLLALGAAYERAAHERHPPRYLPSVESSAAVAPLLAPP